MSRRWRTAFGDLVRDVFARESLPPPPAPERRSRARGLASLLFAIEALPREPEVRPQRHTQWLRWLFLPEPVDGESKAREEH
jgi:hypothetical protein